MPDPSVLAVIPARGGSKGIPRKNIKLLAGHPLIAYTIAPALKSASLSTVVVSTEDPEIKRVSEAWGCRAPFLRPAELATDGALAIPTIQHAVSETERIDGKRYDLVVMLQPTCPFTTAADIDAAVATLAGTGADSVISVVSVGPLHPHRMKTIEAGLLKDYSPEAVENMPRHLLPPVYIRSGDIYAVRRSVLMEQGSFKGAVSRPHLIPDERAVNIDGQADWTLAEEYIRTHGNPLSDAGPRTGS